MSGKLDIYNLGDQGVSLVPSPVHAPDGSYLAAQNAHANIQGAQHGISKRPGLAKLTTDPASSGAILAFSTIPFIDPELVTFFVGAGDSYFTSADGVTFAPLADPFGGVVPYAVVSGQQGAQVFLAGTGVRLYNGGALSTIIPDAGSVLAWGSRVGATSVVYWVSDRAYKVVGNVLDTTYPVLVGFGVGELIQAIADVDGQPAMGGYDATGAMVHRYDGAAWVEERVVASATSRVTAIAEWNNEWYATVSRASAPFGLYDRNGGAWAQVASEDVRATSPLVATSAGLFWINTNNDLRHWNGSAASTELSLAALTFAASLFVLGDTVYIAWSDATTLYLQKRVSAATWTTVLTETPAGAMLGSVGGYY